MAIRLRADVTYLMGGCLGMTIGTAIETSNAHARSFRPPIRRKGCRQPPQCAVSFMHPSCNSDLSRIVRHRVRCNCVLRSSGPSPQRKAIQRKTLSRLSRDNQPLSLLDVIGAWRAILAWPSQNVASLTATHST
jgi:hypothetical protein